MNEPTEQEINEGLARLEGICLHKEIEHYSIEDGNSIDSGFTCKACKKDTYGFKPPNYLTSFDDCRRVMRHLDERQIAELLNRLRLLAALDARHSGSDMRWLLLKCTPDMLARAIWEVVK